MDPNYKIPPPPRHPFEQYRFKAPSRSEEDESASESNSDQEHSFLPAPYHPQHFGGGTYPPPAPYPPYFAYPPPERSQSESSPPAPPYMMPFPPHGMVYAYPPPPPGQGLPSVLSRPKRRQVKMANTNCAAACARCDEARPCERCIKYGIADACVDGTRKERKKGIKRGPYKRKNKSENGDLTYPGEAGEGEWNHANAATSAATTCSDCRKSYELKGSGHPTSLVSFVHHECCHPRMRGEAPPGTSCTSHAAAIEQSSPTFTLGLRSHGNLGNAPANSIIRPPEPTSIVPEARSNVNTLRLSNLHAMPFSTRELDGFSATKLQPTAEQPKPLEFVLSKGALFEVPGGHPPCNQHVQPNMDINTDHILSTNKPIVHSSVLGSHRLTALGGVANEHCAARNDTFISESSGGPPASHGSMNRLYSESLWSCGVPMYSTQGQHPLDARSTPTLTEAHALSCSCGELPQSLTFDTSSLLGSPAAIRPVLVPSSRLQPADLERGVSPPPLAVRSPSAVIATNSPVMAASATYPPSANDGELTSGNSTIPPGVQCMSTHLSGILRGAQLQPEEALQPPERRRDWSKSHLFIAALTLLLTLFGTVVAFVFATKDSKSRS